MDDEQLPVRITLVKDGPLRVRGPVELRDHRNRVIKESDGVLLLCRCGGSARKPFCDGTHGRIGFCDGPDADAVRATSQPVGATSRAALDPHG